MASALDGLLGGNRRGNGAGRRSPAGVQNVVKGANTNGSFSRAQLQQMPILGDREMECRLIDHCIKRLELSQPERDSRWYRAASIDTQLSGFMKLDRDDQKRFNDLLVKGKVKPTDHNLPIADAQLDDAIAYLMSIFAPDMNLWEAAAPADKAPAAKALIQEINNQGQRGQYYREINRLCSDAMKYNFAAITCYWEKEQGWTFVPNKASGGLDKVAGTVWQGNAIKCVDIYNFFYDTNVHPVDLPKKGEWFAEISIMSPFRAIKDEADGKEFGVWRFYNPTTETLDQPKYNFYRQPPLVRKDETNFMIDPGAGATTNWQLALSSNTGLAQASAPGIERIRYVTWLRPKDWKLSTSTDMELYAIHIMQGAYITKAVKIDDTHGMLPISCAAPIEDALGTQQRTYAERLLPLQHFDSFLLNTHQAGVRKSLYGVTVYDSRAFPGLDLSKEDMTSAYIPMRSTGMNVDIDKMFRTYNDAPTTSSNVDMIEKIDAIMQKILPTDVYRQVADLERATLYQAAATVQTGNRRSLKIARMLSNQCLEILKLQMIYNIYANQESVDYVAEDGTVTPVPPSSFVGMGLENYISNGLKGIDRLMIITAFKEVLSMILQSQQAIAEIDIVKLLAYFFNLTGEPVDLNSFRKPMQQRVADSALQGNLQPGAAPGGAPAPADATAQAPAPAVAA